MRKLLVIFALLVPSLTWAGTCGNGYSFSQKLIVKHNLVANTTTLTNFPYLIPFNGAATNSITLTALKTVANSGSIQNTAANSAGVTGPADLVFCDAASAGNALKYEVAQYTASSGKMEAWVQIASLSSSDDQNIWMFYGNSGVSTTQQDLTLWTDASYVGVFHMADGSTLSATDSSGTLTAAKVGSPTASTGVADGAMSSVSSSNYINITQNAAMRIASTITVEGWGKPSSCANFGTLVSVPYATSGWSSPFQSWALNTYSTNCQSRFVVSSSGTNHGIDNQGLSMTLSQWNQLVGTFDGTTIRSYLDGVQSGTASFTGTITYPVNADVAIGQRGTYSTGDTWAGDLDEIRIANVTKTADWIKTEFNNINGLTTQLYVAPSPGTNCGAGYAFSRPIVLRRASGSDQTNYPYLMNLNYASLKTVANSGQVQNTANNSLSRSGPADLQFCPDNSGTSTPMKYEVVTYSATAGTMEAWVQIPTLHSASNDTIYMYLNNASQVATQQDLSIWSDVNCTAIWHFPDGSSLDAKDSCQNISTTINGAMAASTGLIGGSADFPGTVGADFTFGTTNYISPTQPMSISVWGNPGLQGGVREFPQQFTLHQPLGGNAFNIGFSTNNANYQGYYWGITNGGQWGRFKDNLSLDANVMNFASMTFDGVDSTSTSSYTVTRNGAAGTVSTAGNFGNTTNTNVIGQVSGGVTNGTWLGKMDEARIFSDKKSNDWSFTDFLTQTGQTFGATSNLIWKTSPYIIVEPSYATPTIRQYATCNSDNFGGVCPMLPVIAGNKYVIVMTTTDVATCTTLPSDTLGLTFTLHIGDSYTGTIHSYQSCIISAPITSSGFDTITLPSLGTPANVAAVIWEVVDISGSGVSTATSGNTAAPPAAMTATSGGANSFLVCATRNTDPGGPPPTIPSTSEGYSFYQSHYNSGDHPSSAYAAYAVVGSGSKNCTLSSGNGGVMAIFGFSAPATAVRHRVVYE
jgi:hypothetical protein